MAVQTRTVSFSELDTLRQCRFKHQLGYIERWRPAEESEALSRGRLFHEVMEAHYSRIAMSQRRLTLEPVDAAALYSHVGPLLYDSHTGRQTPEQELVEWMYRGYVDCYKLDEGWQIVAVEHPIEEWLPTPAGTRSSFRLKGKIDAVVRDEQSRLWIVDHKTCRNLPRGRELDLDDQFAIYEWLLRRRGNDVCGIIYNAVRSDRLKSREMESDERFRRYLTVRTEHELQTVINEAYEQFREAYQGVAPVGATGRGDGRRNPPRSPNTDLCRWRCPFTEPCLAGRKGADTRAMLTATNYIQDFERH